MQGYEPELHRPCEKEERKAKTVTHKSLSESSKGHSWEVPRIDPVYPFFLGRAYSDFCIGSNDLRRRMLYFASVFSTLSSEGWRIRIYSKMYQWRLINEKTSKQKSCRDIGKSVTDRAVNWVVCHKGLQVNHSMCFKACKVPCTMHITSGECIAWRRCTTKVAQFHSWLSFKSSINNEANY